MNRNVKVTTNAGSYPAQIGSGIFSDFLEKRWSSSKAERLFLVIDKNVWNLHRERIENTLQHIDISYSKYLLPEGEKSKSFAEWEKIIDFLLEHQIKRNSPLIAIGGGVTGDVAGFAAATVLRGIPLFHIPTTLLAMVDSSIGGKTGINHSIGKNLVGSFYQPSAVIADTDFLSTLPDKEWINGLSEILKYAAIRNDEIFSDTNFFLNRNADYRNHPGIELLIEKCIRVKAGIVAEDELEKGIRAYLNFGHTFAHALEKEAGYQKVSHGEAVFTGMLAALHASNRTGSDLNEIRLERFATLYSLNQVIYSFPIKQLIKNMSTDKKKTGANHRLVLLKDWQKPFIHETDDNDLLQDAWNYALQTVNKSGKLKQK